MTYLLDANVFIQAKNLHYGFDFCPAFWDWLEHANAAGRVFSIEKVGDELLAGSDELSTWAKGRDDTFFLKPDATIVPSLRTVSAWAAINQVVVARDRLQGVIRDRNIVRYAPTNCSRVNAAAPLRSARV